MILLTGTGGLFTRLGQLAGLIGDVNAFRGGNAAGQLTKEVNDALAQVDGDSDAVRATLAPLLTAYTGAQSSLTGFARNVQSCAQDLLITMANADTPLSSQDVPTALALLKSQMLSSGAYVSPNTLAASVTPAAGNTGNGAIAYYLRDDTGHPLDNLLAETVDVSVVSNAAAGSERLMFAGVLSVTDRTSWAWPAGSGANKTLTSLAAAAAANLIADGDFETFVANLPLNWTAAAGTPGTDFAAAGVGYTGANALKLIGGTAALTDLTQPLVGLSSRTPYALNLYLKADVVPASGTLVIELWNGSAVIQDEAGNPCSLAIALSGLTTSYAAHNFCFVIGDPLPPTVTLRLRLSAAVPAGSNVFVDTLAMQTPTQLSKNPGDAPWCAVFGGNVNWSLKDTLTLTTTNSRASKWQQAFDVLFGDGPSGFLLPTSGTTLIPDALIS